MAFKTSRIPVAASKRSEVDLSAFNHTTTDFGRLDVVYHDELCAGDDVSVNIESFLRAAPMPCPTFGKVRFDVRAFFVPYRILCNDSSFNFSNFDNGNPSSTHPYLTEQTIYSRMINSTFNNSRRDFRRWLSQMNFPARLYNAGSDSVLVKTQRYSPFVFGAYNRIWWDYYRDSNLIDESTIGSYFRKVGTGAVGQDFISCITPHYACLPKDYFTTAKISPTGSTQSDLQTGGINVNVADADSASYNTQIINPENVVTRGNEPVNAATSAIPYNFIKAAEQLQKYLERNNLVGSRLIERMLARYGTAPKPEALSMSEYLGGRRHIMNIGDITSNNNIGTSDTLFPSNAFGMEQGTITPSFSGQMAGKGIISGNSGEINYHANERGILMVISTLVPETGYFQGTQRSLFRGTMNQNTQMARFEYFTPEMQSLGYQPIYNKELACINGSVSSLIDNEVFGYQPRYSDYTYHPNSLNGDLAIVGTNAGLDSFHLFRSFGETTTIETPPVLSLEFTSIYPELRHQFDRIFSIVGDVAEYDHFTGLHICNVKCVRAMDACALPHLEEDGDKRLTVEVAGSRF